ncbi:MAG: hypothetical protein JSS10_04880 [Verrucomicrobia bacterium]|nr:hypothetical protein [Verrucomicrobiota bacterium]
MKKIFKKLSLKSNRKIQKGAVMSKSATFLTQGSVGKFHEDRAEPRPNAV